LYNDTLNKNPKKDDAFSTKRWRRDGIPENIGKLPIFEGRSIEQ